ncbi:hypothetical protein LZ30DRAFT_712984, partial [Colletotrichum cereale]
MFVCVLEAGVLTAWKGGSASAVECRDTEARSLEKTPLQRLNPHLGLSGDGLHSTNSFIRSHVPHLPFPLPHQDSHDRSPM